MFTLQPGVYIGSQLYFETFNGSCVIILVHGHINAHENLLHQNLLVFLIKENLTIKFYIKGNLLEDEENPDTN